MRSGFTFADPKTSAATQAQIWGYPTSDALLGGFVRAFADACRAGMPVKLRPNLEVHRSEDRVIVVDKNAAAARALESRIAEERRAEKNAHRLAVATDDPEVSDAYMRDEVKSKAAADALQRRLDALLSEPEDRAPGTFTTSTERIFQALGNIGSGEDVFSQDEYRAFRVLVSRFELIPQPDGSLLGSAFVRLPTPDGIAEGGPITWPVPLRSDGAPAMRSRLGHGQSAAEHTSPQALRALLRAVGDLNTEAVNTLVNAAFPELAMIVLHWGNPERLPHWVGPEWRDHDFMRHVNEVYRSPTFAWMGKGQYASTSPTRQAAVDVVADAGHLSKSQLAQRLGVTTHSARSVWALREKARPSARATQPVVANDGDPAAASLRPARCICGRPATIVLGVPEVTTDLLCECGRLVSAIGEAVPDVVFPAAYRRMRISRDEWNSALAVRRSTPLGAPITTWEPDGAGGRVQAVLDAATAPMSAQDIAAATGLALGTVYALLRRGVDGRRFIGHGKFPTVWHPNNIATTHWQCCRDTSRGTADEQAAALLNDAPTPMTTAQIAEAIGRKKEHTLDALMRAMAAGGVIRHGVNPSTWHVRDERSASWPCCREGVTGVVEARILGHLDSAEGPMTTEQVAQALGLSLAPVGVALRRAAEGGRLIRHGLHPAVWHTDGDSAKDWPCCGEAAAPGLLGEVLSILERAPAPLTTAEIAEECGHVKQVVYKALRSKPAAGRAIGVGTYPVRWHLHTPDLTRCVHCQTQAVRRRPDRAAPVPTRAEAERGL